MASTGSGQKGFFLQIVNQAEATMLQLDFFLYAPVPSERCLLTLSFLAFNGHFLTGNSYDIPSYVYVF